MIHFKCMKNYQQHVWEHDFDVMIKCFQWCSDFTRVKGKTSAGLTARKSCLISRWDPPALGQQHLQLSRSVADKVQQKHFEAVFVWVSVGPAQKSPHTFETATWLQQ